MLPLATGENDQTHGETDTVEPLDLDDIEALASGEHVDAPGKDDATEPLQNLQSKLRGLEQEFGSTLEEMHERLRVAEETARQERKARKQLEADARSRLHEAHDNLEGIQHDLERTREALESSEARFLELQHILDELVTADPEPPAPEEPLPAEGEADAGAVEDDEDAETVFEVVDPESS